MKLTRERKVYAAVLALGLGWLVYDQVTGGGAEPADGASAGAADSLLVAPSQRSTKAEAATDLAAAELGSLADRLAAAEPAASFEAPQMRDAFCAVDHWLTPHTPGVRPVPLSKTTSAETSVEAFRRNHKLAAVVVRATSPGAVLDGRYLTIGQSIDGFRLTAVSKEGATFESGNTRVVLAMPTGIAATGDGDAVR